MVPMQDPDAATAELKAIQDQGLHGRGDRLQRARRVDRRRAVPAVLPEAERLGLPVFVHAMPSPDRPAARRRRWAPTSWASRARSPPASMVAGGTAAACPDLRISFSHAAGGFPLMLPRAQYFWGGSWNEEPVDLERAVMHDDGPSPLELRPPLLLRLDGLRPAGAPVPRSTCSAPTGCSSAPTSRPCPARSRPVARCGPWTSTRRSGPTSPGPTRSAGWASTRPPESHLPAPPAWPATSFRRRRPLRVGPGAGRSSRGRPDAVAGPTCLPSGRKERQTRGLRASHSLLAISEPDHSTRGAPVAGCDRSAPTAAHPAHRAVTDA